MKSILSTLAVLVIYAAAVAPVHGQGGPGFSRLMVAEAAKTKFEIGRTYVLEIDQFGGSRHQIEYYQSSNVGGLIVDDNDVLAMSPGVLSSGTAGSPADFAQILENRQHGQFRNFYDLPGSRGVVPVRGNDVSVLLIPGSDGLVYPVQLMANGLTKIRKPFGFIEEEVLFGGVTEGHFLFAGGKSMVTVPRNDDVRGYRRQVDGLIELAGAVGLATDRRSKYFVVVSMTAEGSRLTLYKDSGQIVELGHIDDPELNISTPLTPAVMDGDRIFVYSDNGSVRSIRSYRIERDTIVFVGETPTSGVVTAMTIIR